MVTDTGKIVEEAVTSSIQERARRDTYGGFFIVNYLLQGAGLISPWWSPARDAQLREFWKKSDHLSGALYTLGSKMTAIPFRVTARDMNIKAHVEQAREVQRRLEESTEFGAGWETFYGKCIEDLLATDNGLFAEVIGPGDPAGPLNGAPVSVAHLDSQRVTRTGNPIYPAIYTDTDGRRYKLHYTRVLIAAQMPSPIAEMFGVGICAISRCINVAQTLVDILQFKMEKLGSRPHRGILVTQGGLDPEDVQNAFMIAEETMDNQGASRYAKMVVAGSSAIPNANISLVSLASLPDGFDEQSSITLGMATIALAFGVDARELFPAMTSGATRADALLQHLKQRGKGPGQILKITEQLFNQKFLPPHLKMEFDFQDDAEDRQIADIKNVRAVSRRQNIDAGTVNIRVAREQMLADGDLDRSQFERLELADGRLPGGAPILALFYTNEKGIQKYLSFPGITDPASVATNDTTIMLTAIAERMAEVNAELINTRSEITRWNAYQALSALIHLEKIYLGKNGKTGDGTPQATMTERQEGDPDLPYGAPQGTRRRTSRRLENANPAMPEDQDIADDFEPSEADRQ